MRLSRLYAVAIVLILIASAMVLVPNSVRAAPTKAVSRPAASDSVYPVDVYGFSPGTFYVGLGYGNVYFAAYDPVDAKATVAINDYNATRDGLTNPVATFTPNFGVIGANYSYNDNVFFQLPLGLQYGGHWNITISGASAGFYSMNFTVQTYTVSVYSGASAYLPDHSGSMYFYVNWTVNSAPVSSVSSVQVTGQYTTTANVVQNLPGTPMTLSAGQRSWNFTVPSNANTYSDLYFRVFANTTPASGAAYSVSSVGAAPVGYVPTPSLYIGTCASTYHCQGNLFASGTLVFALVQAVIYTPNGTAPAPGLAAKFRFDSGVLPVTPTGNFPQNLTTNITGGAEILFNASATTFNPKQVASLNVTLTDPLNAASLYGPVTATFRVLPVLPVGPEFLVQFGSDQYYAGDTAQVNWWFGGLNATSTNGWTISSWTVWSYDPGTGATSLLAWGALNSTATSGTFNAAIPVGSGGEIVAGLTAYNATGSTQGYATAYVTAPELLVNPSEYYYQPGDTVTVSINPQGSVFTGATYYETATASSGGQLTSGMFSGTSFSFQVPTLLTGTEIYIAVSAQTLSGGVIAASQATIYRGTGLSVTAGVQTASNYADGSYQPGQTITISYHVFAVGKQVVPRTIWIYFYPDSQFFGSTSGEMQIQTTSPSGTFQYTIPSNQPAGELQFFLYVEDQYCSGNCYPESSFGVNVVPNPSALGYELGAGSGVTVGWVILLVIILLVAVALLWTSRRRGGGGGGRSAVTPYSSSSSSTPSASSGSGSSSSWSEGSGSSGSGGSSSPPPQPEAPK